MNLQEFKAWFEGFTENMKKPPSAKAWARIKERVGEIAEKPVEVRYIYSGGTYYPYYHYYTPTVLCQNSSGIGSGTTYQGAAANLATITNTNENPTYGGVKSLTTDSTLTLTAQNGFANSSEFFTALGKNDACSLGN